MEFEGWRKWDNQHDSDDQKKRISKAYAADNTPLSIDRNTMIGRFQGSSGRYETSIEKCTCIDFVRRKLPCKHMYRLAIELELFGEKRNAKADQYARKVPKSERNNLVIKIVGTLENYLDAEQVAIKDILRGVLYHQQKSIIFQDASIIKNAIADGLLISTPCYTHFIRKMLKRDMLNAISSAGDILPKEIKLKDDIAAYMINRFNIYGPMLFPNCAEVTLSAELNSVSLSVYKYLHRKFDKLEPREIIGEFNPITGESQLSEKVLPDDFETGLLNMFGTNPLEK